MALQTSTLLQRCHSNFWVHLSRAYGKLREMVLQDCGATGDTCTIGNKTLVVTLTQTALLFRPYFTWRLQTGTGAVSNSEEVDRSSYSGGVALQDTRETSQQDMAYQDTPSTSSQDILTHQDTPSLMHQDTPSTAHQDILFTVHQDTAHQDIPCSQTVSRTDSTMDVELCVFSAVPVSQDPSLYLATLQRLGAKCHTLLVTGECGLVPALNLPLCFCHSPFVMVVRQLLRPDGFVTLTALLHQRSLSHVAHQLWASVYAMAQCSCLVWARYAENVV